MNGDTLFWFATGVLIGEGVAGPATATYFTVGVLVTLWALARQQAAHRKRPAPPSP
jgi:hypothetical protein